MNLWTKSYGCYYSNNKTSLDLTETSLVILILTFETDCSAKSYGVTMRNLSHLFASFDWHWTHSALDLWNVRTMRLGHFDSLLNGIVPSLARILTKQHGIRGGGEYLLKTPENAISETLNFKMSLHATTLKNVCLGASPNAAYCS